MQPAIEPLILIFSPNKVIQFVLMRWVIQINRVDDSSSLILIPKIWLQITVKRMVVHNSLLNVLLLESLLNSEHLVLVVWIRLIPVWRLLLLIYHLLIFYLFLEFYLFVDMGNMNSASDVVAPRKVWVWVIVFPPRVAVRVLRWRVERRGSRSSALSLGGFCRERIASRAKSVIQSVPHLLIFIWGLLFFFGGNISIIMTLFRWSWDLATRRGGHFALIFPPFVHFLDLAPLFIREHVLKCLDDFLKRQFALALSCHELNDGTIPRIWKDVYQ